MVSVQKKNYEWLKQKLFEEMFSTRCSFLYIIVWPSNEPIFIKIDLGIYEVTCLVSTNRVYSIQYTSQINRARSQRVKYSNLLWFSISVQASLFIVCSVFIDHWSILSVVLFIVYLSSRDQTKQKPMKDTIRSVIIFSFLFFSRLFPSFGFYGWWCKQKASIVQTNASLYSIDVYIRCFTPLWLISYATSSLFCPFFLWTLNKGRHNISFHHQIENRLINIIIQT